MCLAQNAPSFHQHKFALFVLVHVRVLPYSSEVFKLISREIRLSQRNAEVDSDTYVLWIAHVSVPVSFSKTQSLVVKLRPIQAHFDVGRQTDISCRLKLGYQEFIQLTGYFLFL